MSGGRTALVISPDRAMAGELAKLLDIESGHAASVEIDTYPSLKSLEAAVGGRVVDWCFLDVSSNPEAARRAVAEIGRAIPGAPVVAMASRNESDLILRFLRDGVNDFLVAPFTNEQLGTILEKLGAAQRGKEGTARVLCVMPAKGSSGASTIASHLAEEWARGGKKKVLLADLDPLSGTLSFLLKIKSTHSFADVLIRSDEIDEDIWKAMVCKVHGVDMLVAPETLNEGMGQLSDPSPLVQFSRGLYDTIILDAGGAYGPWNCAQALLADEVLLVTSCEVSCVYAAMRALSYLKSKGVPAAKIRLVVNREGREGGMSPDVVGEALEMEILQVIPEDAEAVYEALVKGKLVSAATQFGKALSSLAESLSGAGRPVKQSGSRESLISLFSGAAS